eukprot:snap_masked-scaffold_5-processed-gene-16.32-mRNA-1 protein AED:0.26 eAED:0.26 QI:0/-1/0/1/-1/1/1/0/206
MNKFFQRFSRLSVYPNQKRFQSNLAKKEVEPVFSNVRLRKLQFTNTGEGETPSSVRRKLEVPLYREVLVQRMNIPGSPQRLNLIARMIRTLTVQDAMDSLRYLNKGKSGLVMQELHKGIQLAKDLHGLGRSDLYVAVCGVGKGHAEKRVEIHGRGRSGVRTVKKAHLTIVLREMAGRKLSLQRQIRKKKKRKEKLLAYKKKYRYFQ